MNRVACCTVVVHKDAYDQSQSLSHAEDGLALLSLVFNEVVLEDHLMRIAEDLFCSFKRDFVDALVAFILG